MKKITLLIALLLTFIGFTANAQYSCATGVAITDGYTANAITTPGTGGTEDWNSPNPTASCAANASYWDDDVYMFTYTAGANNEEISMSTLSRNNWNGLAIFTTCSGTALDDCLDSSTSSSTSNFAHTVTATISAGQTVYIATGQWGTPNDLDFDVTDFSATPILNPPNCDSSLTETIDVAISGDISWSAASGSATGYKLVVGTTMGGNDVLSLTDVGNVTTYNLGTLTLSTTYYVTIKPYNGNGDATGCIEQTFVTELPPPPPPANDECANAVVLTVNADLNCGTVTAGTTVGATASAQADDVTGTPNTDVWFTFVATVTTHTIKIKNVVNQGGGTSTSTDMGMGVYDGTGTCAGLVLFDDSDPETLSLTGLSIGVTYYVRVYGWYSSIQYNNFDICVGIPPPPPANDDCTGALTLTPGGTFGDNPVDGTVVSATANAEAPCNSGSPSIWYSIVVPADGNITIEIGPDTETGYTGFDSYIEAFSGSCGALVSIDCDDDGVGNLFSLLDLTGLAASSTIYVLVWEFGGGEGGPFAISAYNATLGVGDNKIDGFKLYPNPVSDLLNFDAQETINDISIYSLLGKEVMRVQPNTIKSQVDISSLATGMYVVKVQVGDKLGSYRIIKE